MLITYQKFLVISCCFSQIFLYTLYLCQLTQKLKQSEMAILRLRKDILYMPRMINLSKLTREDFDYEVPYEPLDWNHDALIYPWCKDKTVIIRTKGEIILVNKSMEKLIEMSGARRLTLLSLNAASFKAAGEKYCGIVHGKYRMVPSAGFDQPDKCWIMAHYLHEVYEEPSTGMVTLIFKVNRHRLHVVIDANIKSLKTRLSVTKRVSHLQLAVASQLFYSLGMAKQHPHHLELEPDFEEVYHFVCEFAKDLVAQFVNKCYSDKLTAEEELVCTRLSCKFVSGKSISKELRRCY